MANVSSSNGLEKYPRLRFKGFSDPWKVGTAEELFDNVVDKNHPEETVLTIIQGQGTLPREAAGRNIHYDTESLSGYKRVMKNDYVIHLRSFEGGLEIANSQGIVSPAYTILRSKKPCAPLFFDSYFHTDEFINHVLYKAVEGIRDGRQISYEAFKWLSIPYCSLEEQSQIAAFLEKINLRIEKQRSLVEHLKKYKRGVIKEFLTPQTCPIKNAVWSKATIGELGTFVKGAPLSKADISDEGVPFILYGELYTTYGEVINKVVRKTQRSVDNVYLSRIGDVLIPTSGETPEEISTASCVMVSDVILAGDLNIFRTSKVDGRIMSYVLNHIVNSNIARIAQGKSVVHIQASEISKISIFYPDENTQQQLITIFGGISEKITLAEDALANMIMLKKSIIQKMFI